VARADPDRALEIVGTASSPYGRTADHARLAWNMYEADPVRALEYARGLSNPVFGALALGYLALRVDDQEQARAMVAEAIESIGTLATALLQSGLGENSYALAAARLAWIAQEVGYPDVQRPVTMALALRPARPRWVTAMDGMGALADLPLALGWADADVARALLEPVVTSPGAFDYEEQWRWQKTLQAMAVADPEWAAAKVRELAAAHPDAKPNERWHWHVQLVEYLVMTRDEQFWASLDGWLPGKWEDE